MRPLTGLCCLLVLVGLAGCGHVAANYPVSKAPKVKELPETYQNQSGERPLIWQEANAVHGFLDRHEPAQAMAERMRRYADMGNAIAAKDAQYFAPMAREGLALAKVRVFVAPGVEHLIEEGDFLFTFDDGSTVTDSGAFLYGLAGTATPPASSRGRAIRLSGADDPDMDGRSLYIFLPKDSLSRRIVSIALVQKG